MQSAATTRVIHATAEAVWEVLRDVTTIARFHSAIASVDLLTQSPTGLHAARRCNFRDGTSVREDVTELEEQHRLRFELSEFAMPMKRLQAEFRLAPGAPGSTEVTFEIFFEPKFGPLGKMLGALAIRGQLVKVGNKLLAGLDHYLMTGESVGADFVARAA